MSSLSPQASARSDRDAETQSIVATLAAHANQLPGDAPVLAVPPHAQRVAALVRERKPIEMVILGFPAKSPNRHKTYSDHADLAEVEGLRTLHRMCAAIAAGYQPGAVVHVCSDGHVFADLVHVADATVDMFQREIEGIIAEYGFNSLRTFSAGAYYQGLRGDALRARLVADFAKDVASTRTDCLHSAAGRVLLGGIHRFLFEDDLVRCPQLSRNKVRQQAKLQAYEVIRRSQSFGQLVQACFPDAIRLSIHPQLAGATKLGIRLVQGTDRWATPWHNVLVRTPSGPCLMHRAQAEAAGARLSFHDGRLAFFELPG